MTGLCFQKKKLLLNIDSSLAVKKLLILDIIKKIIIIYLALKYINSTKKIVLIEIESNIF